MFKSKLINLLNNLCEPSNKSYYFVEITIVFGKYGKFAWRARILKKNFKITLNFLKMY